MPQRQEALFEAKMNRKRLVPWNFGDIPTSYGEFFILRTHTPLPTFRQTPHPLALQKGTPPPLAGKILRPPTFFNLSTYACKSNVVDI